MNSIISVSTQIFCRTVTVHGFVYAFWIVHGDLDFQIAEVRAAETLGHLRAAGQRAAVDIQPTIIAESGGLNE
jgi:hypothetical protein